MAITLQLGTEDNLPINKATGGLEELRTGPPNQLPLVKRNGTDLKELLRPRTSFTITGKYISFLIGGGCDIKLVRTELIIGNKVSIIVAKC